MIRAGDLRHRIQIWQDQNDGTATDLGELAAGYAQVATRWGAKKALSGRELERARQAVATATHEFRIRYTVGLNPRHQLRHGGATYEIGHVGDPDGLLVEMVVLCTERPDVTTTVVAGDGWQLDFSVTTYGAAEGAWL